jgi:hypothetical protein
MGMFDRVWVSCPKCNEKIEYQSKAGNRGLNDYTLADAPAAVLGCLAGDKEVCPNCHEVVRIVVAIHAWAEGEKTVAPRIHGRDE